MNSRLLLIIPFLALPSCGRLKGIVNKAKEAAETTTSPAKTTGTSDVRDLTAAEFSLFTTTPARLMIVDFHADWCGPCKVLGPVLSKVAGEFPNRASIGKIDVDQAGALAQQQGVSSIPDVRFYRDGKQVHRFVGVITESELRGLFSKHTKGLSSTPENSESPDKIEAVAPPIQPMTKDWLPPGVEKR